MFIFTRWWMYVCVFVCTRSGEPCSGSRWLVGRANCPTASRKPMDFDVFWQMVAAGKLLLAHWTLVGFDPRVGPPVSGQFVWAGKPVRTKTKVRRVVSLPLCHKGWTRVGSEDKGNKDSGCKKTSNGRLEFVPWRYFRVKTELFAFHVHHNMADKTFLHLLLGDKLITCYKNSNKHSG